MPFDRFLRARNSLRARLLWWIVPPAIAVGAIGVFVFYTLAARVATDAYDVELFDMAKSLAEQIKTGPAGEPVLALPIEAEQIILSDPYDQIFFRVLSPSRELVAGRSDVPAPREALTPEKPARFYDTTITGQPVRAGAYALFDGAKPVATVLVAETLETRRKLSDELLLAISAPVLMLILLLAAIVWFGVRQGLNPLQHLTAAISQRGWHDLSAIGGEDAPEEVRPLTHAIDDLMRRLGLALTSQQRFISEAAHQLVTPLAGLSAQTERVLLTRDVDAIKPAMAQLQISAGRMTRLVSQLLALARAEPGSEFSPEFKPVDLAALVQQTCIDWVPEALKKNVDLGFSGETGPVTIRGNASMLTEMLNNLIDNALRYGARPGGVITVRLSISPRVEICVEDDGPGIPEEERLRVFDRFHRVPGSAPGGAGLGLTIVREIARAHGAEVHAAPAGPHGGTAMHVVFGGNA